MKISMCIFITLLLGSCGSWYYCTVSGFGKSPTDKTYYIAPVDSSLADDLEYLEYTNILSNRLKESGYTETSPQNAALCIILSYYIGGKEFVGTTSYSSSSSFSISNGKIITNANASAEGNSTTKLKTNSTETTAQASGKENKTTTIKQNDITFAGTNTETTAIYQQDIGCIITAINRNKKNIWKVEVKDHLDKDQSFRKIMPWMIAAAQEYFGKNGEATVKITKKEGIQNKGLIWPYSY